MYSHNFICIITCTDIKKNQTFSEKVSQSLLLFLKVVLVDSTQDSNKHLSTETIIQYFDMLHIQFLQKLEKCLKARYLQINIIIISLQIRKICNFQTYLFQELIIYNKKLFIFNLNFTSSTNNLQTSYIIGLAHANVTNRFDTDFWAKFLEDTTESII